MTDHLGSSSSTAESLSEKPVGHTPGRLRWKKHDKPTGLARVGAGPRGSDYTDGVKKYATVYAHSTRHTGNTGWYWVASQVGEYMNTCDVEGMDEATAKQQAQEYVKAQLAKTTT